MDIMHVYQRTRAQLGKHADFRVRAAETRVELPPDVKLGASFVMRQPTSRAVQCAAESAEHEVNTQRKETKSSGMLHSEGGWPKEVEASEPELVARYRKKVERDDNYQRQVKELSHRVEYICKQNNAINLYEDYFSGTVTDHSNEPPSAKTLTVFRDPQAIKRTATSISWSTDGGRKLAISYSLLEFQKMPESMSMSSYIWDIENPNFPEQELSPPSPLVCVAYNPKDPNVIVGGTYNGLLTLFDVRTKTSTSPTEISPIEKSHRDPVYDVTWIASKSGTDFFSVSTDGQVLWWDYRRMGEPLERLLLEGKNGEGVFGGVSLDYDSSMPNKFLVGTEQGSVISCNRKAKRPEDRLGNVYSGHHGPIYALHHNPFFPKYFLTVGDWTAKIWSEDQRSPIMSTRYHMSYLTDGCWSPTRPGVFFTTRQDGYLDVWDFYFKQNDPTFNMQVSDSGLHCLSVDSTGRFIATGDREGSTTLLELGPSLYVEQKPEKNSISQMFDRESKREKNLEARAKEMRLKEKRQTSQRDSDQREEVTDDLLRSIEEEFFALVRAEESAAAKTSASAAAAAASVDVSSDNAEAGDGTAEPGDDDDDGSPSTL